MLIKITEYDEVAQTHKSVLVTDEQLANIMLFCVVRKTKYYDHDNNDVIKAQPMNQR